MRANLYQTKANETAVYPNKGKFGGLVYTVLGLAGEAGEVSNKVKKIIRDKKGKLDADDLQDLDKELGDVAWYLAQTLTELGLDFEGTMKLNLSKLADRKKRGTLKGSGDHR